MMSCRKEQAEVHAANTHAINLRSGPYLDEEVVSISETNLNQTYADPGKFNGEIFVAVKRIEVDKSNGVISQQALDSFEVKALDFASHHFYCDCPDPDHQVPIAYDIWIDSTNTNYLQLAVKSIVGTTNENLSWPRSFGPGAEYPAVDGFPFCNNSGTPGNKIVPDYVNFNKLFPLSAGKYLDEIVTKNNLYGWSQLNPNDANPGDFIMDYRTFRVHCIDDGFSEDPCHSYPEDNAKDHCYDQWTEDELWCLDQEELNFYRTEMEDIVDDPQNKDPGEVFIIITVFPVPNGCTGHELEYWTIDDYFNIGAGAVYGKIKSRPIEPPLLPLINCNESDK